MSGRSERRVLEAGIETLNACLALHGFRQDSIREGVSSGGSFAAVTFRCGAIELGVIVRQGGQCGGPSYSTGHGYAGHTDVVSALGAAGQERLVPGSAQTYVDRDGGDPFAALRADLENIILSALANGAARFGAAVATAVWHHMARLGVPGSEGHSA